MIILAFQDDTCIGGLVMVLSNPDEGIVKTALEVLILNPVVQIDVILTFQQITNFDHL